MAQPTSEIKKGSKLECVMILAFGNAAEPIHRSDISELKRKPLLQITNSIKNEQIIEPARLAP